MIDLLWESPPLSPRSLVSRCSPLGWRCVLSQWPRPYRPQRMRTQHRSAYSSTAAADSFTGISRRAAPPAALRGPCALPRQFPKIDAG